MIPVISAGSLSEQLQLFMILDFEIACLILKQEIIFWIMNFLDFIGLKDLNLTRLSSETIELICNVSIPHGILALHLMKRCAMNR